jgi:hypothetical protein
MGLLGLSMEHFRGAEVSHGGTKARSFMLMDREMCFHEVG